ncbi:hypothetical protein [Actinomadura sp. HBU206391]|uniref:GAP1-N2 domain-containing protein n=1 Tax=Actinomadura sp. HBU206391 TaxID=2731692 RepID=UPI00164F79B0|nr:hypothetical protein [Actinomadura sp. HBU206391]MBC6459711.1 hypothetical protein [Actinomadura sp. HBU206391]
MAWQLHYTSAKSGPSGRAGFQFVAETPGLPPGLRTAVTPLMVYRPPPHAPLSPTTDELARFPVGLAYDRVDERPVLVRCRYLGRDYSGRYGNFFAHAVVAEAGELEGLRPMELWRAPLWDETPANGRLPALDDLSPGGAIDPESLADWLADQWDAESAYDLLARLIDAVTAVLGREHGRIMLVAGDTELIARWMAVVSYSLPVPAAALMSFITYSADPEVAPQRVVGTTPDVWETTRHDGPVFFVDARRSAGEPPRDGERRYARTAARCWRDLDFAGLDAMGELADAALRAQGATALDEVLDQAAALLALCQGDESVTQPEEAAAAALLKRHGADVPDWVWRDLTPTLPGMGFDLAVAIMAWAARDRQLADRCAARCVVLALRDPGLRSRLPAVELPEPALVRLAPIVEESLLAAPDLTEVALIAELAERVGADAPGRGVEAAAAGCARRGAAELTTAVRAAPSSVRERLIAGALAGLDATDEGTRAAVLTDAACDLLYPRAVAGPAPAPAPGPGPASAPDPASAPVPDPAPASAPAGAPAGTPSPSSLPGAVALHVLRSVGRRRKDRRVEVTRVLIGLAEPASAVEDVLRAVWAEPPTAREGRAIVGSLGAALPRFACLYELPARVFTRLAETGDELDAPDTLELARRTREVLPADDRAAAAAAAVQAYAVAVRADEAAEAARGVAGIVALAEASGPLTDGVVRCAAQRLALRAPEFRTAVLANATATARDRLVAEWTGGKHSKAARNELMEVAIRLRRLGISDEALEEWAAGQAAGRLSYLQLDTCFRHDRDLRAGLKDLRRHSLGSRSPAAQTRRHRRGR